MQSIFYFQHLSCTGQARVLSFCPGPASRGPLLQAYGADILQATAGASSHADQAAASSSREPGAASPAGAAGPPVPADASGAASQAETSAPAPSAPAPEPDSGEAGADRGAAAQHDVIGAAPASTGPGVLLCRKPGLHAAGACVSATAQDGPAGKHAAHASGWRWGHLARQAGGICCTPCHLLTGLNCYQLRAW